jgi:3-oxoacyl-[acyl-carrier protein] reductase
LEKKLNGKAALVTGGGTGTGRAIALALAGQGAAVAVNYSRSREDAERTVGELARLKAGCLAVRADVANDAEVREMVRRTIEALGGLDILVNCAGYTVFVQHRDLEGLTDEIWQRTLDVNLRGVFICSRAAVPEMRKNGWGCIINIAGTAGVTGLGSSIVYCASKAGILSLTRSLAMALAPEIQVNAISPGIIEDTRWTMGQERFNEAGRRQTPMGRLATTADIAEAALYLAAGGHFITGQNLVVDGGRLIHH